MRHLLRKLGISSRQDFIAFTVQFLKFGIVGLSNTLISLLIYYALLYVGVHYLICHICGFAISVLNAFYWNSRYVFGVEAGGKKRTFIKTVTAYGGTFLLGLGFLWLLVDILGFSDFTAPVINLCLTIPLNFLLNKFWAFNKRS